MAERKMPAASEIEISYRHFAEQIDAKSGIPVGLVPLEVIFENGIRLFKEGAKIHDIGGGTGASFEYILSKAPLYEKTTLRGVVSEPFNEIPSKLAAKLSHEISSFRVIRADAMEAATNVKGCDLVTMINMIHLIPKKERAKLLENVYESMNEGGYLVVATTFIDEWVPNTEVDKFSQALAIRSIRIAQQKLDEDDFNNLRKNIRNSKLHFDSYRKYTRTFKEAGFEVVKSDLAEMPCTLESYALISKDEEWLKHLLPGVELSKAAQISQLAVAKVKEDKKLDNSSPLPRNTWVALFKKPDNKHLDWDVADESEREEEKNLVAV